MLNSHTHRQAAQGQRASQSLSKSVSEPMHGQKRKSTIVEHCIRAIAGIGKINVRVFNKY